MEGPQDTLRGARVRAAHRARPRLRRVRVPLEVQHPGAGQEVQGVRHRPARLRMEREGAGGVRRHHLDGAGLRLPQGGRQVADHPRWQQLRRVHDAAHGDRAAGAGPRRRAAQLRRAVRGPQRAAQAGGGRGGGGERGDEARRQAAQGGVPAGGARVPLLAGQAAGQGRESPQKRVQRPHQRRRLPHRLHHGADGGPQRRRGVLQVDVAVHGEPEPVHAGQAAGQAVVPAAAAVGGPGPVGRPGQGRADQRVLPQLHRRQPAGRPLPSRRGAGAVQQGAARVARLPGDGDSGRAHSPGRLILALSSTSIKRQDWRMTNDL